MTAVLLDLYETLLDTDWGAVGDWLSSRLGVGPEALFAAFQATRLPRGLGHHGSVIGDLSALAAACGSAADEGLLAGVGAELLALLERHTRLYPDVLPTLRRLRAAGVRTAIVSNCDHVTRPLLDRLALADEIDAIVLSCEIGAVKPDAAIFHHALDRLGARAAASVFVDDQPAFLDGAAALGLRTLHVVRDPARWDPPSGSHPRIPDLADLPERAAAVTAGARVVGR